MRWLRSFTRITYLSKLIRIFSLATFLQLVSYWVYSTTFLRVRIMEFTETRRLYQQLAAELKQRIESKVYLVGEKLPAERYIAEEMNVSRTVVREAIIMLEVEGYVEEIGRASCRERV